MLELKGMSRWKGMQYSLCRQNISSSNRSLVSYKKNKVSKTLPWRYNWWANWPCEGHRWKHVSHRIWVGHLETILILRTRCEEMTCCKGLIKLINTYLSTNQDHTWVTRWRSQRTFWSPPPSWTWCWGASQGHRCCAGQALPGSQPLSASTPRSSSGQMRWWPPPKMSKYLVLGISGIIIVIMMTPFTIWFITRENFSYFPNYDW